MDDQSLEELAPAETGQGIQADGDESRLVVCDYCDAELELSDEELAQGWYVCPECDELSHLAKTAGEDSEPALEFPAGESMADWVPLTEVSGSEAAALVVTFLRANGVEAYTWQEGAGRAYGLSVGSLGASHIMVREDQVQLASSILEAEAEEGLEEDDQADDSLSDTSKAIMGLTAAVFNPVGTGLAFGLSQVLGRHDGDEQTNLVECVQCGTALELSDQEVAQGNYICPECQQLVQLSDYVICPVCQTQLALDKAERQQGWYRCPECDQVTQL